MADRPETAMGSYTRSESDRVDEQAALLGVLVKADRSRAFTVQAMPDGCEVIEVADGLLYRKIALIDVTPMSRLPVAKDRE